MDAIPHPTEYGHFLCPKCGHKFYYFSYKGWTEYIHCPECRTMLKVEYVNAKHTTKFLIECPECAHMNKFAYIPAKCYEAANEEGWFMVVIPPKIVVDSNAECESCHVEFFKEMASVCINQGNYEVLTDETAVAFRICRTKVRKVEMRFDYEAPIIPKSKDWKVEEVEIEITKDDESIPLAKS